MAKILEGNKDATASTSKVAAFADASTHENPFSALPKRRNTGMRRAIKSFLKSLPLVRQLFSCGSFRPGHFYSPIPSLADVSQDQSRIFDRSLRVLPGIELNIDGQIALLTELSQFYEQQPFFPSPTPSLRYYFENPYYSYGDAIFLYCMIRFAQPKQIIEIGSGFSSFVMLDTNETQFEDRIRLTFIDPDVNRLRSRLLKKDLTATTIIPKRIQDVDFAIFETLVSGDILFVDSSHVSKIGSDLNHILFEILPRIPSGVFVHFHDVFYPFEYPQSWIERGFYWNENYILRAFLQFNSTFKVRIWNQFIGTFQSEKLGQCMPLCMKNIGGSLWLQKV